MHSDGDFSFSDVGWNSQIRLVKASGEVTTVYSGRGSIDLEFDVSKLTGNYYIEFYGYYWQDAGTVWKFNKFELT